MATEFISILAIPRTGTNYLCGLLGRFSEIDSLYEIYHNQAVYLGNQQLAQKIIEHVNRKYQLKIKNHKDLRFINFVNHNPQEIIKIIRLYSTSKYISFKIFPNHLSKQDLSNVIIQNKQIKKIVIQRNLLDVYFSLNFAKMTASWSDQDTSNLRLDFNPDHFLSWYTCHQKYYQFIEEESKNHHCKISILKYETIHRCQTNRDKFIFMFDFLRSIGLQIAESNLSTAQQKLSNLRVKQDKRLNIIDKVNNPDLLTTTLQNNKLEFLLT
ncbi:MAG: hypothetical protein ACFCAD_11480 [Pleurocapsa sp.]